MHGINKNHARWTAPDGTTRARAGIPLDAAASASRVSQIGHGREFDILDAAGVITARVWYIPAGDVLSAAQQSTATGFADMDNVINSQVALDDDFYNTQETSSDAAYDATREQCYFIISFP